MQQLQIWMQLKQGMEGCKKFDLSMHLEILVHLQDHLYDQMLKKKM
jgi:hypothetical protein